MSLLERHREIQWSEWSCRALSVKWLLSLKEHGLYNNERSCRWPSPLASVLGGWPWPWLSDVRGLNVTHWHFQSVHLLLSVLPSYASHLSLCRLSIFLWLFVFQSICLSPSLHVYCFLSLSLSAYLLFYFAMGISVLGRIWNGAVHYELKPDLDLRSWPKLPPRGPKITFYAFFTLSYAKFNSHWLCL